MKNLKKKFSEMAEDEEKKASSGQEGSGPSSPQPSASTRGGRGRGRGRGRTRGRRRSGEGEEGETKEWSLQKYDFEAPDIQKAIEGHKPNFVKAEEEKQEEAEEVEETSEEKKPTFKKVSREEWSEMSKAEKKKYLRERKKWKLSQTVFIKDDSDNEQLTDDSDEDEESGTRTRDQRIRDKLRSLKTGSREGSRRRGRRGWEDDDDDYNEDERDVEYGSWAKNDLFRLEKAVMCYGWGRWEDIMCHAQLRRGWTVGDVEVSITHIYQLPTHIWLANTLMCCI